MSKSLEDILDDAEEFFCMEPLEEGLPSNDGKEISEKKSRNQTKSLEAKRRSLEKREKELVEREKRLMEMEMKKQKEMDMETEMHLDGPRDRTKKTVTRHVFVPMEERSCRLCLKKGHSITTCEKYPTAKERKKRLRVLNVCRKCLRVHPSDGVPCRKVTAMICTFCRSSRLPHEHPVALCSVQFP